MVEANVRQYTLPDALMLNDGTPVTDAQTWMNRRRPEIMAMFEEDYYGKKPPRPDDETFEVLESSPNALGGKAIRKQAAIHFKGFTINTLMYLPAHATGPSPVFVCLSFAPLHAIAPIHDGVPDSAVLLMDEWETKKTFSKHPGKEADRGGRSKSWPTEHIIDRGYGVAYLYYNQIEPDFKGGMKYGVRGLYPTPADDEWGAIGAWSWGASRAVDYLLTDTDVDAKHLIMMGQSRLGKTSVWEAASDDRFAMDFACNSGRGGASLARRNLGETIDDLAHNYGYQFCGNFQKFAADPTTLPMDTHELLACIAPRPVYLTTGSLDQHSDPHGEFLAARAASPVFELLGGTGITLQSDPPLDVPVFGTIAYSEHTGKHEVTAWDWDRALDFADWQFKGVKPTTRLAD